MDVRSSEEKVEFMLFVKKIQSTSKDKVNLKKILCQELRELTSLITKE
jgi:hypothetical protein